MTTIVLAALLATAQPADQCPPAASPAVQAEPEKYDYEDYYRQRNWQRLTLDKEIRSAEDQRTNGLIVFGTGVAVSVASYLAFVPGTEISSDAEGNLTATETGNMNLYLAGLVVGGAVEIVGLSMFAHGWWTASYLKTERIRLGLAPAHDGGAVMLSQNF